MRSRQPSLLATFLALAAVISLSAGILRGDDVVFFKDLKPAPALRLTTLDGQTIDVQALRGKIVFLNFWATWCGPCRVAANHRPLGGRCPRRRSRGLRAPNEDQLPGRDGERRDSREIWRYPRRADDGGGGSKRRDRPAAIRRLSAFDLGQRDSRAFRPAVSRPYRARGSNVAARRRGNDAHSRPD